VNVGSGNMGPQMGVKNLGGKENCGRVSRAHFLPVRKRIYHTEKEVKNGHAGVQGRSG